ncbi:putative type I methylase [Escherichia coli]|uniref:Putative type I methylase n=1 Tax=Escherichia coli TaxID=562 RepID=A0A377CF01_ECOLX|nr:putative type I methylase [Escherichia coli]
MPAVNSRQVKTRTSLAKKNIKKIVKTYRDGDNVEKYAYLASLKEISG